MMKVVALVALLLMFPQAWGADYPQTFVPPPPPKPWKVDAALVELDKEQARTAFISQTHPYTLANLFDAAAKKGQKLFDIESGRYSPTFASCDLGAKGDWRQALEGILAREGWGYEMRGEVMVIFNRKLRALGDAYPLNRRISSLVLTDVSLDEAFHIIGRLLHVEIMAGGLPVVSGYEPPFPRFSVSLHDVTLREALFMITPQLKRSTWNASLLWVPPEPILCLSFQ